MSTRNILGGVAAVLVAIATVFSCSSPTPTGASHHLGARGAPPIEATAGLEQVVQTALAATPSAPYLEAGWGGACCLGKDGAIVASECESPAPPALAVVRSETTARG